MSTATLKTLAQNLLSGAGITLNGERAWDIQVHNEQLYERVMRDGSLGLGDSYVEGWWDCDDLSGFFCRLLKHKTDQKLIKHSGLWTSLIRYKIPQLIAKHFNLQSQARAFQVGEKHYDRGNDFFSKMLDTRMNYTCAYWARSQTLEDAQLAKLALSCGKLKLRPGMRVLDIGCGWGGFAKYAAEQYNVSVVGVTVSKEQAAWAQAQCQDLPVEIRLQDYRDIEGQFDRVVSLGMFEHVGPKNYRTYMKVVNRVLRNEGLFLLHTIGGNSPQKQPDPWLGKHIFPNGVIPSAGQIGKAIDNLLVLEDVHNFGPDYDKTLIAWHDKLQPHWSSLEEQGYDEPFRRLWHYYLLSCAGAFRARDLQLWQMVLSKGGVSGAYKTVR